MKREKLEGFYSQSTGRMKILGGAFFGIFLLLTSVYYIAVVNPLTAGAFSGTGSGSEVDPYQIANCVQLQEMQNAADKSYILIDDLDCSEINGASEEGFNPFLFSGTLDGRNHRITNFMINRPSSYSAGLFSILEATATVKNLYLDRNIYNGQPDVIGKNNVGALAAESWGATVENVHSSLWVQAEGGQGQSMTVGGLIGLNRGIIRKSSSTGKVTLQENGNSGRYAELGGLVGRENVADESQAGMGIFDSYSTADVTTGTEDASLFSYTNCGGLVGVLFFGPRNIERSYSTGQVYCTQTTRSGGFIGLMQDPQGTIIQNNFTRSDVVTQGINSYHEGFIGYETDQTVDLSSNYFDIFTTTKSTCTSLRPNDCSGVNNANEDPNYFQNLTASPQVSWDFASVWEGAGSADMPMTHLLYSVTPDGPTDVAAVRDQLNGSIQVSWTSPVSNEGRADNITDYVVQYKLATGNDWVTFDDGVSASTSASITGIEIGEEYRFRVRSINDLGNGLFSDELLLAPESPSQAPANLAAVPKAYSVELDWDAAPLATGYVINYKKSSETQWLDSIESTAKINVADSKGTVYSLASGVSYDFRVVATNQSGSGPPSTVVAATTVAPQNYTVSNCAQLQAMKNDLEGNYVLSGDIDCSETQTWNDGQGFEPVGEYPNVFSGSFDGKGKTIEGLYINRVIVQDQDPRSAIGIGLFGVVGSGGLKNVNLDNPVITGFAIYSPEADQNGDGIADGINVPTTTEALLNYKSEDGINTALGLIGKVGTGSLAGIVMGSGGISDVTANNVVINANVAGGVFGAYVHANVLQGEGLAPSDINDTTIARLKTSGVINAGVGGGISALAMSVGYGVQDPGKGSFVVKDSSSSATVTGSVVGGIIGVGGSAAGFIPTIALSMMATEENPVQPAQLIGSLGSAFTTQAMSLENVYSTGSVTSCGNLNGIGAGSYGGLVGIGLAMVIKSSYSTGEVSVCSGGATLYNVENGPSFGGYGGVLGGLGGTMLLSRIEDSSSSSNVVAKRITEADTSTGRFDISANAMGGLAGVFISTGGSDAPVVQRSHATGSITANAAEGGISIQGGLFGLHSGSGTIANSYATGNVSHNLPDSSVVGVSLSGGISGVSIGIDAPYVLSLVLGTPPQRTQGIVTYNTYATGDVSTTKQESGFTVTASGGMYGLMLGGGEIQSSHATGKVGLNPRTDNLTVNAGLNFPIGTNVHVGVNGGLVGVAAGFDMPLVASAFLGQPVTEAKSTNGINISSSYASGDVRGIISGGLIGYGDMLLNVNKAYAEGDVEGNIIGGLMGASGVGGTAAAVGLGAFALPLIESRLPANEEDCASGTTPSACLVTAFVDSLDRLSQATGPVTIANTYATGNLKTVGQALEVEENRVDGAVDVINPTPMPSIAGGLVGLYATPGGSVRDSYASGEIVISKQTERTPLADAQIQPPRVPSFAGGIFGIGVALPQPDYKKIKDLPEGATIEQQPETFLELFFGKASFRNLFSASKITVQNETEVGGIAGVFGSPLNGAFGDAYIKPENLYTVENVYADQARIQVEDCTAVKDPYNLIINGMEDLYIKDGTTGGNTVPDEDGLNQEYKDIFNNNVTTAIKRPECNYVNKDGNQAGYFKNNKTNPPHNTWDFENVWVTRKDDYPKFVAGASDSNPGTPPSVPSDTPIATPVAQDAPVNDSGEVLRRLLVPAPRAAFVVSPDSIFKQLLRSVPPLIARSIPYLIILMILLLAARYARQALREYMQHRTYHKSIMRILATKTSVDDFLALTTHYLNTPAAIMSGALELLESLKKAPASELKKIKAQVKGFADTASRLLSTNQVSAAKAVNDDKVIERKLPNPLRQKEVWMPLVIAAALLLLANALFMYADVYTRSPLRLAIEFLYLGLSATLMVLSYRYRALMEHNKEIAKGQLAIESQLYQKRESFLVHAALVTHDSHLVLETLSKGLKKVPEAKLYFNGLNMLGEISKSLDNVKHFADFSVDPPLFDVSSYLNKAVSDISQNAARKKVDIKINVKESIATHIQPGEIKQLVDSLLDNAVKFSKEGGTVWVSIYRRFNRIVLVVSDEGEGISHDKLPSLLKPFARATDSMQYNHEGIGLSLYCDKVIVDKLGGHISIRSTLNEGTTVTITLPLQHDANPMGSLLVRPESAVA